MAGQVLCGCRFRSDCGSLLLSLPCSSGNRRKPSALPSPPHPISLSLSLSLKSAWPDASSSSGHLGTLQLLELCLRLPGPLLDSC